MNLKNRGCCYGLDSSGSGYGPVTDTCEYGNEDFFFIKG